MQTWIAAVILTAPPATMSEVTWRADRARRTRPADRILRKRFLVASSYLNQMRWYSRLIGWSSSATSAPSNMRR